MVNMNAPLLMPCLLILCYGTFMHAFPFPDVHKTTIFSMCSVFWILLVHSHCLYVSGSEHSSCLFNIFQTAILTCQLVYPLVLIRITCFLRRRWLNTLFLSVTEYFSYYVPFLCECGPFTYRIIFDRYGTNKTRNPTDAEPQTSLKFCGK
jgi:hypothetical protein